MHETNRYREMLSKSFFQCIKDDSQGATAVEYGLLIGLIALSAMVGISGYATEMGNMWNRIGTTIGSGISAA